MKRCDKEGESRLFFSLYCWSNNYGRLVFFSAETNVIELDLAGGRCAYVYVSKYFTFLTSVSTFVKCKTKALDFAVDSLRNLHLRLFHIVVSAAVTHPTRKYDWFQCSVRCRFACVYASHNSHGPDERHRLCEQQRFGITFRGWPDENSIFHSIRFDFFRFHISCHRTHAKAFQKYIFIYVFFCQVIRHENECT